VSAPARTSIAGVPASPEPFRWDGDHLAADLGVAHVLFTSRRGGVSRPPFHTLNLGRSTADDPAAVHTNRERLASAVGVPSERFAQSGQVHGRDVVRHTAAPDPDAPRVKADGHATSVPGVAALVLTADCLPVAVAAPGAVAMLHAGWRGLAAGVLQEGVAALRELGAEGPVVAAIGPGAGGCCYEVGDEVRAAFADVPEARDGRRIDLKRIARDRLREAGVAEVHDAGVCTLCDERFFSHRRERGVTGRQAGVAWLS
jgi:polyphenol oxidase